MLNPLEKIKELSEEGNWLGIITNGEGEVSFYILSEKPDLEGQSFINENEAPIEILGIVNDINKVSGFMEECLIAKKAEEIRENIKRMDNDEIVRKLSSIL